MLNPPTDKTACNKQVRSSGTSTDIFVVSLIYIWDFLRILILFWEKACYINKGRYEIYTKFHFTYFFQCLFSNLLSCWVMSDSVTGRTAAHQDSQPFILSLSLLKFICTKLCWWCYLTISSSAARFCFFLQSFPASGSFPVSLLFASGGQSIGASASASVLTMNI